MSTISTENLLPQSPYLYMQAAGSDGSDGSAPGVHLRWDFARGLGDYHIPKGNLAEEAGPYYTAAGYNKADDFVKIYRTPYNTNYPVIVDFSTMSPEITDEHHNKEWRYSNIIPVPGDTENTCNVIVRFPDIKRYGKAKNNFPPDIDANILGFLQAYDSIIEVEVEGRLMFSAYVYMTAVDDSQPTITRIESISLPENTGDGELFISCRKKYIADNGFILKEDTDFLLQEDTGMLELDQSGSGGRKVMAENIQYIRFKGSNCFPQVLRLETYHDFILGKNLESGWDEVVQLALSVENTEVFERLEKPGLYTIDNEWPKYNEGDKVNADNYRSRWSDSAGLKTGVISYLVLSQDADNLEANNPIGTKGIPDLSIGPWQIGPEQEFGFSYLNMLKLVALDFHVARMLGFGHIDKGPSSISSQKYIYVAMYKTTAALEEGMEAEEKTHTYMTLPVSRKDYKLPPAPQLKELRYGMFVENGTDTPTLLTDSQGYSPFEDSRTINLDLVPFDTHLPLGGFFIPDEEFCYVGSTKPILYGVEYKKYGDTDWVKPELNNDPDFTDHNGISEVFPVIGKDENPIFTHIEKEEGEHLYAMYSINWFSRVSSLSNIRQTDETIFPIRNTLMPPLNFGVQLIQEEEVLIFTTQAEQAMREALTGDKTLVRLTFDWNNIHSANYWYGRQAEFFFRTDSVNFVRGRVKSVDQISDKIFEVRTQAYYINSYDPPQLVMPAITAGTEENYVKSIFTVNDNQYIVISVVQSLELDEGPVFTLEAPHQTQQVDADLNNLLLTVDHVIPPHLELNFAVAENTSRAESWPLKLNATVELKKLSDHVEIIDYPDGTSVTTKVGGYVEQATITEVLDKNSVGDFLEGSRTGIYIIDFDSFTLPPHGDSKVEWYKGAVRIHAPDGSMRVMEVWNIDTTQSTLKLFVYDGSFEVDQYYHPTGNYLPIVTGTGIDVNFHPGYRVYLTAETGFDESILLPAAGEGNKQSFMACRSVDTTKLIPSTSVPISSYLSTPAVLLAREIIKPLKPNKPSGPLFATRPDFYGKATYTFDTVMNTAGGTREPYALVFYRATEQIILDTLYKTETVAQIRSDLASIEEDTGFSSRWNGLVNVAVDGDDLFEEWNGYRFPNPDNNLYRIPDPNPKHAGIFPFNASTNPGSSDPVANTNLIFEVDKSYKDMVKLAIDSVFLSLTEQPVIYQFIRNGYQTSGRKPVLRNSNGELLIPAVPGEGVEYDGAPMAVKFEDESDKVVRFTDYTLDGASKSVFFYYAVEMNNALSIGERSDMLGPIQLVNTAAPKAPEFKKFYTQPANSLTGDVTAMIFEINNYLESDGITKIQIYRALNAVDALTVRSMTLAATITIGDQIIDDFSDLTFLPFGETLYYRLVALRTIKNEFGDFEDVPSLPSTLVLGNIIDVFNPPAPDLTIVPGEDSTDELLQDVMIEWGKTAYNGTYYLYQMNNTGNWVKIYQVQSNDETMQYELPDDLVKVDEDENPLYYRFKVSVENSSGLLNIEENEKTI